MWIVDNKSFFAIGISAQCSDKGTTEETGKNCVQSGTCNLKEISRSLDLLDK